jgi:16S rRNA (uracil1498-N3)-methyltransferase
LRVKRGESIFIFDGSGKEYRGIIEKVSQNEVEVKILEESCPLVESSLELILIQGVPKAEKMDLIVKGTTELGVSTIKPFFSSRTIPRWKDDSLSRKVLHWQKIGVEAARQSGRTKIPEIMRPVAFEDVVNEAENLPNGFLKIVLWEGEKERGVKEILRSTPKVGKICFFVGPEGGFSGEEVRLLKNIGCISVSLGNRILRTETASITLLSIIQYEWGDLG